MRTCNIVTITSVILIAIQCVAAQIPGCFPSSSKCCKSCKGAFATCPDGWQKSHEEVPGFDLVCYCCRPYTTEERLKMLVTDCDDYLYACSPGQPISCRLAAAACARSAPYDQLQKLCEKSKDSCNAMCDYVRKICAEDSHSDRCDIAKLLPESCKEPVIEDGEADGL